MKRCPSCGRFVALQRGRGSQRKYCTRRCKNRMTNRCRRQRCDRYANFPDGLCSSHYRKMLRSQPAWTLRDDILDFLDIVGGWATAVEIATRFNRHIESVERVLRRLRDAELIEGRVVELARTGRHGSLEARTEWRLSDGPS